MARLDSLIPVLSETARYQREAFQSAKLTFDAKGVNDFVSEVDRASQRMVIEAILKSDPGAGYLAEEAGGDRQPAGCDRWYVIDPLDGTGNFKSRIPIWAISVALIEQDTLTEGVIVDVPSNRIFTSWQAVRPPHPVDRLSEVQMYALDSSFENRRYDLVATAKRRQVGATVLANLLLTQPAFMGRASLDFALMGNSAFWDVAGAAAFLRQIDGAFLVEVEGRVHDLLREPLSALMPEGLTAFRKYRLHYVASASRILAQSVVDAGYLQRS